MRYARVGSLSFFLLAVLLAAGGWLAGGPAVEPYDLLIVNGRLVDGSGNPWTAEDLAVRADRIVARGDLEDAPARRVIDARGLVVAPGFIDMLGQSEFNLLVDPTAESKVRQGITTEITGEGSSAAPQNERTLQELDPFVARFGVDVDWRDLAGYFDRLEERGIGINLGTYVGATQVREMVLGTQNRAPTDQELVRMRELVRRAMRQGALGLSSSLVYAPANYASTEELIALARVASDHGGIYATHMRGEGRSIFEALEETFTIAREADIAAEIFHLKVAGEDMWGRMKEVIERIEQARAAGLDIAADQYPYIAGATSLGAAVPPRAHAGGREKLLQRLRDRETRARLRDEISRPATDWENFYRMAGGADGVLISSVTNPQIKSYEGLRLSEIAERRGEHPIEALFDILLADQARTGAIYFLMSEEDVRLAMKQPWVSVDTDYPAVRTEGPLSRWKPHPRAYGSFPRILGRYVREQEVLRLEEAVRKMTWLAARRVGLDRRGLLAPGFYADIVIFDPRRIRDRATFEDPQQYSVGVEYVVVNGQLVLDQGEMTGALPGRPLRGPGWRPEKTEEARSRESPAPAPLAGKVIDLSYAIHDELPAWPGDERTFEARTVARADEAGYFSRSFWMLEHYGTHLDAPVHFPPGEAAVDEIPPARLVGPAAVIDVQAQVRDNPDYRLRPEDITDWESRHGEIPPGAIVLARTGWAARWPDQERYRNMDDDGVMHFPGFSLAAVRLLIERGVSGLGIDTLSVDYGPSEEFEVHQLSHGAGLYHLENLADLSALPEQGAWLVAAPIKLRGGSGGAVRVFAFLP